MTTSRHCVPSLLLVVPIVVALLLSFTLDSLCCIGFSAFSSLSAAPYYPLCCGPNLPVSHLTAKGVPNVPLSTTKLNDMRGQRKCQHAEFSPYQTNELRRFVTFYPFFENKNAAQLSCSFDPSEHCAWHNAKTFPFGRESESFKRGRFEAPEFNWDKFECTGERKFPLEGFFLIAGTKDESLAESTATIEAKVPCQTEKAMLKFDYWSINETPTLKVCVVPEADSPQCEESKMDINPLTFEIPQNAKPFRIRIEVDNIAGRDDVVLIGNIHYDQNGKKNICPITKSAIDGLMVSKSQRLAIDSEEEAFEKDKGRGKKETEKGGEGQQQQRKKDGNGIRMTQTKRQFAENGNKFGHPSDTFGNTIHSKGFDNEADEVTFGPEFIYLCEALQCNFNIGKACNYKFRPVNGMSTWTIGDGPRGNPHTGIHKNGRGKTKLDSYAFVGGDLKEWEGDEVFVLRSPKLRVDEPITLQFDLFQRSVGPQLTVCLNSFRNCPYESPTMPDKVKHWLTGQKVVLPRGTERVFFLGSKLRRNHFIAIDNIRLMTMNFREICRQTN